MFRRILLEDYAAVCTTVAFVVALTIFATIAWRALRMPRQQSDKFANLPFAPDSTDSSHDDRA